MGFLYVMRFDDKVYWENGAQIISPHDTGIAAAIENNLSPWVSSSYYYFFFYFNLILTRYTQRVKKEVWETCE